MEEPGVWVMAMVVSRVVEVYRAVLRERIAMLFGPSISPCGVVSKVWVVPEVWLVVSSRTKVCMRYLLWVSVSKG